MITDNAIATATLSPDDPLVSIHCAHNQSPFALTIAVSVRKYIYKLYQGERTVAIENFANTVATQVYVATATSSASFGAFLALLRVMVLSHTRDPEMSNFLCAEVNMLSSVLQHYIDHETRMYQMGPLIHPGLITQPVGIPQAAAGGDSTKTAKTSPAKANKSPKKRRHKGPKKIKKKKKQQQKANRTMAAVENVVNNNGLERVD